MKYTFFYISWGLVVPRSMAYASNRPRFDVRILFSERKGLTCPFSPLDRKPEIAMPNPRGLTFDTPAVYRIGVQGFLDKSWSDRMNGVNIRVRNRPDGASVSVLTGRFIDQAALAGVINTLYDLGFPLLKVELLGVQPIPTGSHP
jgi:hypothetical protein